MSIQDSSHTITTSAKRFFSGTLISRFTGLVREVAMAAAFGTVPAVAAFWMAFRFAYLLRRLFGEGALNAAFIPHFESVRKEDPQKGARFFYDLSSGLTLILLFLIFLLEAVLGGCLLFKEMSEGNQQVVRLTMILLPALVFISLYALNSSLLNCERTFFLPSVAPTLLNFVWIAAIFFFWQKDAARALEYLAMVIVFAFALQWAVTLPPVLRYLSVEMNKEKVFSGRALLKMLRPFLLGIIGVAATQINSALDTIFARIANPEGPAFLWYAIRIQQLPLALFGVGLSGALLPPISRALESGLKEQYRHFLNFALKRTLALMIPVTAALLLLGFSGVNLVYGHGEFSQSATLETTLCLWAYGVGLLPMTAVLIFASAFYAQKNYRIPTLLTLLTVGLNVALNAFFVFVWHLGAVSIALATALTACVNCTLLAYFLEKELDLRGLSAPFIKVVLSVGCAACATLYVGHTFFHDNTLAYLMGHPLAPFARSLPSQLFSFGAQSLTFSVTLLLAAFLFRAHDLTIFFTRNASQEKNCT